MVDYTSVQGLMNRYSHTLRLIFLAALLGVPGIMPGFADQSDPRLPDLFRNLHDSESPQEAHIAELTIWRIWGQSGSAELDRLMAEGEMAMGKGDYAAAAERFDAVIKARPDFAEGWNRRATMNYLAGNYAASLADIERVLELEPRHFGAISGLGLVNMVLGRDGAARDAFERVLSLYPLNMPARVNLDIVAKRLGGSEI